jgi:hypothetical protein
MWQAATVASDQSVVDVFHPDGDMTSSPYLVPALESFQFNQFFTSIGLPRLGRDYVAAFIFVPPASFATPISFIRIAAPAGFTFDPTEDCSPDSTAALNPLTTAAPDVERSQLTASTQQLIVGWCKAVPHAPATQFLRRVQAQGASMELIMDYQMQAALLSLPKAVTEFNVQHLFRVKVRHPWSRVSAGEHTWSLSLLDADQRLIAQSTGLDAYQIIGDLAVSLIPSNRVLSAADREERNFVAVVFKVTSKLSSGGKLLLKLPGGSSPGRSKKQSWELAQHHGEDTIPNGHLQSVSASILRAIRD